MFCIYGKLIDRGELLLVSGVFHLLNIINYKISILLKKIEMALTLHKFDIFSDFQREILFITHDRKCIPFIENALFSEMFGTPVVTTSHEYVNECH